MQGDDLKAIRKAANLSQQNVADLLDMSLRFVGKMERGEAPIEKRVAATIEFHLQHRIDVSYSRNLERWTVTVTGPYEGGALKFHEVRRAFEEKAKAEELALEIQENEFPLAKIIIYPAPAI